MQLWQEEAEAACVEIEVDEVVSVSAAEVVVEAAVVEVEWLADSYCWTRRWECRSSYRESGTYSSPLHWMVVQRRRRRKTHEARRVVKLAVRRAV